MSSVILPEALSRQFFDVSVGRPVDKDHYADYGGPHLVRRSGGMNYMRKGQYKCMDLWGYVDGRLKCIFWNSHANEYFLVPVHYLPDDIKKGVAKAYQTHRKQKARALNTGEEVSTHHKRRVTEAFEENEIAAETEVESSDEAPIEPPETTSIILLPEPTPMGYLRLIEHAHKIPITGNFGTHAEFLRKQLQLPNLDFNSFTEQARYLYEAANDKLA